MKISDKILLRDIRRLCCNWVSIVILIGISLLPSLYAWFNIAANKDPYGNVNQIKIAVANLDEPAEYEGQAIDVGGEIVSELKSDDQLGWRFVEKNEALRGLRAGDYYAAIIIPKDFSASFLSIIRGEKVEFPVMKYYVNEKFNAIAPKITESGFNALEAQINSQFVSITSEIVAEELAKESGKLVSAGAERKDSAVDALAEAEGKLKAYEDKLREMDAKLERMDRAGAEVREDVEALRELVDKGEVTLGETRVLLENTRRGTRDVLAMYDDLLDDMETMTRLAGDYSNGKYNALDGDFARLQNGITVSLANFQRVNAMNEEVLRALQGISPVPEEMKPLNLLGQWGAINRRNGQILSSLQSENQTVASSLRDLERGRDDIASDLKGASDVQRNARRQFRRDIPALLEQNFDFLNQINGRFAGILSTMPTLLDAFEDVLAETEDLTKQSHATIASSLESLDHVQTSIGGLRTDLEQLSRGPIYEKISTLPDLDAGTFSTFMSEPVGIEEHPFYETENYGSAMTPFFTNLALWVGGMILVALFKLEVDREDIGYFTPAQGYLGRWKLFVFIGLLQAFAVAAGDIGLLKVRCIHPFYFILTALIASLTYISIIFALTYTFRNIGKAIAVIVLILQIPGASGTYPIEMMAPFFQAIYPILPFHYGINAMRETMFGIYGTHLVKDWLILLAYVPIFLFLGFHSSRWLDSIGRTFDLKIAESELVIANYPNEKEPLDGGLVLALLRGDRKELERIREKHERFFESYQKKRRHAFLAIFVIPMIFLVLMFNMESKIVYLVIWIATIIAIVIYLIWLELHHYRYRKAEKLMELSEAELLEYVKRNNDHEDDLESY
ncbi:MAG: YhgE/Pip domain-containing protein [Peptoniphilus sp.]|nr:YhgE/Pip domain-containing protein [Peptoniphilus sp.]MDD7362898.1 YhgE/Pip domain-containing protein [Bacillota bacterium]MDY6045083.1 YhgE/Pip domain-containing protein [Peptoniphilus sp.]